MCCCELCKCSLVQCRGYSVDVLSCANPAFAQELEGLFRCVNEQGVLTRIYYLFFSHVYLIHPPASSWKVKWLGIYSSKRADFTITRNNISLVETTKQQFETQILASRHPTPASYSIGRSPPLASIQFISSLIQYPPNLTSEVQPSQNQLELDKSPVHSKMAAVPDQKEHCKICQKSFPTWEEFLLHKIQSKKHISCLFCGQDFKTIDGCRRHQHQVCQLHLRHQ